MNRLVAKGKLERQLEGKRYAYLVKSQPARAHRAFFQRLKEQVFGGEALTMITHLLSEEELSSHELDALEAMIRKKRAERGLEDE
jgi:predicted transcriptional regulator